jgi:hypothetical protein
MQKSEDMQMEQQKSESVTVVKRPLGVWILTMYAVIFAGFAPLIVEIILLYSGGLGTNSVFLIFSILINASLIFYSAKTWQGNDRARKIFLILITINYVLIGLNNLAMLLSGQIPADEQTRLYGRVLRGVLYPAIFIWYFNRSNTKEFYGTGK